MDQDDEIDSLRKRHHDLSDVMNKYGFKIELQEQRMTGLRSDMDHLAATSATLEQLRSAMELMTLKIQTLSRDVGSLQDSVTWVVRLVLGAVITSVIGLIVIVAKLQ